MNSNKKCAANAWIVWGALLLILSISHSIRLLNAAQPHQFLFFFVFKHSTHTAKGISVDLYFRKWQISSGWVRTFVLCMMSSDEHVPWWSLLNRSTYTNYYSRCASALCCSINFGHQWISTKCNLSLLFPCKLRVAQLITIIIWSTIWMRNKPNKKRCLKNNTKRSQLIA